MDFEPGQQPGPAGGPPTGKPASGPEATSPPGNPPTTAPRNPPTTPPTAAGGPRPAPAATSPPWADRLAGVLAAAHTWLMRPRVRLSVAGVSLLLVGVLVMANSVWTLPLVIVGSVMVVIAWIGHRLEGRFTVEWGHSGTELAFRATIKPARHPHEGLLLISPASHELVLPREPSAIVDGEAHTIEIDVAELKALIAAAESAEAPAAPGDAAPQEIRIRRAAHDGVRAVDASR
jgi:hypothetical protein